MNTEQLSNTPISYKELQNIGKDDFSKGQLKEVFPEFTPSSNFDLIQTRFVWPHTKITRRIWEYLMFAVSVIVVVELSYVFIFDQHMTVKKYSIFFLFDILQLIDNFVIIRTPFLKNGIMVSNVKEILHNYGIFSYIMHVLASVPLGWIGLIKENVQLYLVLSINRLFRLHQAFVSYGYINNSTMYAGTISRLLPHVFMLFFGVHIFACIFFLIAKYEGLENSWISYYASQNYSNSQLYAVSIYFVMTTILTIGYGDIYPLTAIESVVCVVIQVCGVAFQGFLIAKIVSLLDDPYKDDFLGRYNSLKQYLIHKGVDNVFTDHIRHYYQHLWALNHGTPGWNQMFKGIPTSVKSAVKLELCQKAFSASELFHGLKQKYILTFLDTMEPVTFIPGQIIFQQGEKATDLIIFNSGIIETIIDGTSVGTMTADSPFADGERSLFFDEPRTKTLKAVSFVEGWKLHRESFISLVASKVKLRRIILANAKNKFPGDFEIPPGIPADESSSDFDNELSSGEDFVFIQDDSSGFESSSG